jgi:PPOX class probable F420-dependent enzyme
VQDARFGVLGTISTGGGPHLVPVTYAYDGDRIYTAVDHKPKTTRKLQRLANIDADPRVSLLVEEHSDDWTALWWCRLDGTASVVADGPAFARAVELLGGKYDQYATTPPQGPAIVIQVTDGFGWRA